VIELTNCLWCDPGNSMCQIQYFLRMILLMVYAANHDTQVVSVLDTSTNSVINTITVGSDPSGVGYDPDNGDISVGVHGEKLCLCKKERHNLLK
jgi:YVTN family beta-propeller protein